MAVQLNHTIVYCKDSKRSANFLADLLGRPKPTRFGPFQVVTLDNGVSLDFYDSDKPIRSQHYAFLIDEETFDAVFARMKTQGLAYWADPGKTKANQISHNDGGRGLYFEDPDGHWLEVITRPYGGS